MKYFVTSDHHFRHDNIRRYQNRPFDNIHDHDKGLVDRWNEVVSNEDVVIHLGDFLFGNKHDVLKYLGFLNFKEIRFVYGNHDKGLKRFQQEYEDGWMMNFFSKKGKRIVFCPPLYELKLDKNLFVFCHYAMLTWNKAHHASFHCYGHSHGNLPENPNSRSMDVGVDCNNYYPFSLDEVIDRLSKKNHKPLDHHK